MRASEYRRGRRAVILAGITAGVVLVVGLLRWEDLLAMIRLRSPGRLRLGADRWASEDTINPEKQGAGQKVYISEGRMPVIDFLKFLSDYTGLPLLHDSSDQNIASKEIHIAADIREADEEVVKAILEVSRFRVFREVLPSGKEVLKVESMQPTAAASR